MAQQQEIYDYLRSVDCCKVCCLRFLKATKEDFMDIDAALLKRGLEPKSEHQQAKKLKENVCIACLGLFDLDRIATLACEVKENETYQQYQCEAGFLTSISLPIVLHLRQLALWLDMLDRFPQVFSATNPPDIAVKDALKMIIIHQLEKTLGKPFSVDGVMINVPYSYVNEQEELSTLELVSPGVFASRKSNKHTKKEFISRNAFEKHFTPDVINKERFRKHYSVPPVSKEEVGLVRGELSFTGPTIFLAGRYNKFSRELSQTPWMIDGKRKMEGSVQETIAASIAPHFGVSEEQLIFSSSGREDVDVRCLGEGRPFVLEIIDAKMDQLPEEVAIRMEQQVGTSKTVAIRDVQLVKRDDLVHIRGGEEDKRKFYRALCVTTNEPVTQAMVQKLRIDEPFVMQQVTPLRVLHRRTLLARPRTVYSVRAFACRENPYAMVVDIVSQAGTYIKELVHSDFGRTGPSFRSIIGTAIDIHALDVMAIDLDWPKKLRRPGEGEN
ncbi:putative tRNA pseudouridine synthase Pus10 [Anopheles maculipalpis]|uniref:putative tRNA pseudouridine synthase Pus10 n=1 Tax=Anopheles maculipalpis TaxID=1496333 RepID=UPI00215926D9|nr:putative tRNA pseudouridine synthase Pus10 [Anopheles maculipalpis]